VDDTRGTRYRSPFLNESTHPTLPHIGWPCYLEEPWSQYRAGGQRRPQSLELYVGTPTSVTLPSAPGWSNNRSSTSGMQSPTTPLSVEAHQYLSDSLQTLKPSDVDSGITDSFDNTGGAGVPWFDTPDGPGGDSYNLDRYLANDQAVGREPT